jgi:hypothetical protein
VLLAKISTFFCKNSSNLIKYICDSVKHTQNFIFPFKSNKIAASTIMRTVNWQKHQKGILKNGFLTAEKCIFFKFKANKTNFFSFQKHFYHENVSVCSWCSVPCRCRPNSKQVFTGVFTDH